MFTWEDPEYSLMSARIGHEKKRFSGKRKVGSRAPVAEMSERHARLVRSLGSGGKKNKGMQILNLRHLCLPSNTWTRDHAGFKLFMKELAMHLELERWEEIGLEVCTVL
jgi:hypothetical protein